MLVGLWLGFCVPRVEEHSRSSKSTLKDLEVFCTLHFKSRAFKGFLSHRNSYAHVKLAHGWALAPTVLFANAKDVENEDTYAPLSPIFFLLDIKKSGFDFSLFHFKSAE